MKIAITGVGGGVGQSILKSLLNIGYDIITLDHDHLAPGLHVTNKSYLVPLASDKEYIPKLLEICNKENISLLFPGTDPELLPLSLNRELFEEIGTIIVVSRPEVIRMADNKLLTYEQLVPAGINVPKTIPAEEFDPSIGPYPVIIKQQLGGSRSQNVFLLKNEAEGRSFYNSKTDKISSYIVMPYIQGDEYTCGTISLDGECKGVIIMRRILRDGDTHKAFVVKNDVIEAHVIKTVEAIKPFGACNIQLRLQDNVPYVFEINARCSGTTAARSLSGFNEPKMIADFLLKGIEPEFNIKEQTILRYWKELVVENEDLIELKNNKYRIRTNVEGNF